MSKLPAYRATILLVDDEPSTLTSLAAVLQLEGYDCRTASDAATARELAQLSPIDLIISDIDLGGDDGLTVCQELRDLPGLGSIPVMFLSGAHIPDIIERAHDAGAFYYLQKPFDPEVLVELVQKALWMPHLIHKRHSRLRPAGKTEAGNVKCKV